MTRDVIRHDGPLIVGAGLAGLSAALGAAPRKALLVSPVALGQGCSSAWAQGGIAAALYPDDAPALHAADTLAAGAGLGEETSVRVLTDAAAATVERLAALGAPFDRDGQGRFVQGLEAAHSRARIVRAGGDGAGRAVTGALIDAALAAPHLSIVEGWRLAGLLQDTSGHVQGARFVEDGRVIEVRAASVILATGGLGGLYAVTTNPPLLRGESLGLAALAGADILDPEFVQFHPTAIDIGADPAPLATEALRGEGARLVDRAGDPIVDHPQGDLAPRDIVARAVHAARVQGRGAFLDARIVGADFPQAFPAVFAACAGAGIDPRDSLIPVAPAAHYHMGGIAADVAGRTSVPGLFAVGECAATGVHGANRLASNSLLEAAAFGWSAGQAARDIIAPRGSNPSLSAEPASALPPRALSELRAAMSRHAGVVRDEAGLSALIAHITDLETDHGRAPMLVTARLVAEAALARRESRGGHFRSDFPETADRAVHTRRAFPSQPRMIAAE